MAIRVAINGYGRIGRNILRAMVESGRAGEFDVVAINDLGDPATNAHLTQYDTAHGTFQTDVRIEGDHLVVGSDRFLVLAERDPAKLPWKELDVDVVLECTGRFKARESAGLHLAAGAKKVLISAPGKDIEKASDQLVSNASCTTNCLAPMAKALNDSLGIQSGLMTTIHAYTNDQVLTDVYHKDLRRARSATMSMIPTTT